MHSTQIELDILLAAKELFIEKGFSATSTTAIAKKAGCTQALVHYYYRTKENLFEKIYDEEFSKILAIIKQTLYKNQSFHTTLKEMLDVYFDYFQNNPKVMMFIFQELWTNPERRALMQEKFFQSSLREEVYERVISIVQNQIQQGVIRPVAPSDIVMHLLSLVSGVFFALPIYRDFFIENEEGLSQYIQHRKEEIYTLLIKGLSL